MDYKAFFDDVLAWIGQVNQQAMQHGMESPAFWQWVADSCGALTVKYQEHRLAVKQMMMMVEWLEEVYEKQKGALRSG